MIFSKFIWKEYGVVQSSEYKGRSQGWAQLPALTLTCCVASDKPLNVSVFRFPLPLKQKYYHSVKTFFEDCLITELIHGILKTLYAIP